MKAVWKAAVLAGLIAVFAVPTTGYALTAGEAIKARRNAMKALGGQMKIIVMYLKAGKGTQADVVKAGQTIASIAPKIPSLFPKGSSMNDGVGETGAKPVIWEKWADFQKAAATLKSRADAFVTAAQSGNKGAIGAALGKMGKEGCGGCHTTFRMKLKKK